MEHPPPEETIPAQDVAVASMEEPQDVSALEQDALMKQEVPTPDVEMAPVGAALESVTAPSTEEKKEIEAPAQEGGTEMTKYEAIDEVANALDQVSAPALETVGATVAVESGTAMDSATESTTPASGEATNNDGSVQATTEGMKPEEAKPLPQENGDTKPATVQEVVQDQKMPAAAPEDSKPPLPTPLPQPKLEEPLGTGTNGDASAGVASLPPLQATVAATTDSEIKDATAQSLVVLKAGPDGHPVPFVPPHFQHQPKHVKKGEVLKRPQNVTTVVTRNGKTWQQMFEALVAYKEKHGDCYVPDRFKNEEGVCLGLWVRNQRRREESLTEEQHKSLTELGLDWQTQNERFDNVWHERYAKLTMYRVEHGDCKVPYTYKADPALAKWVSQQRAQQAQGRLAADRKAKLDAIDFSWKLNTVKNRNTKTEDKKWMRQYEKLVEFHQANGHCKVPDRYKPDRPLGTWVKKQRLANACNQLKEDRKKMLDDLSFVWRITDKTDGEKWDRMFTKLKEYKEENGTCHVSRTVPDSDLKPLARWVKTQRALYKSGKILPDRKARLETIDFVWDGTQLPIKRKRRRPSEEGETTHTMKIEMPMPAIKRTRMEDTDVEMKAIGEDGKVAPEKKVAAKRVLPTASQKADPYGNTSVFARADSAEVKGAAALTEMGDMLQGKQTSSDKVEGVEVETPITVVEDKRSNGNAEGDAGEKSGEVIAPAQTGASERPEEGKAEPQSISVAAAATGQGNGAENSSHPLGENGQAAPAPLGVVAQDAPEKVGGESTEEEEEAKEETIMI